MSCPDKYDIQITDADDTSHGLICDWARQGAGLTIDPPNIPRSTDVSTKGSYGVRDANDYFRVVQTDWSEGGAQELYDREADSENAFYSSENIDVSTVGQFSLGPGLVTFTDTDAHAAIIAALYDGSSRPLVFLVTTDSPYIKYSYDNVTWADITAGTGDDMPDGAPVALATDGQYVYAADASKVYRGTTTDWSLFETESGITALAFCSGILYGTKGSTSATAQLGTFTGALNAWTALSPAVSTAIDASGSTFGLVTSGRFVYWGITNGMVTKVYKAQYGGGSTTDTLQEVASFPTGFVGACMYAYLDTVYVGGHFDGATASTGLGAIYAIVNDAPARLTDVGSDRTADNRVLAMTAYERQLYFVSNQHVWRWDLVHGGYSHWAGPVNSTTVDSSIVWTKTWDMSDEPTDCTITSSNAGISYASASEVEFTALAPGGGAAYAQFRSTGAVVDTTGTTLEMDLLGYPFTIWPGKSQSITLAILGSAKDARIVLTNPVGYDYADYTAGLYSGTTLLAALGSFDGLLPATWRLTLKNGEANVWKDGTLLASKTATTASTTARVQLRWDYPNPAGEPVAYTEAYVDRVRWSDDGAYDPNAVSSFTGYGMAAARDAVWVAGTGVEIQKTSGTATSGHLVASQSSGNMPTVDKYLNALTVQCPNTVPVGGTVGAQVTIDGVGPQPLTEDATLSDSYLHWFPIEQTGRRLQSRIDLTATNDSPVVAETAVLFTPMPKTTKLYSYFVRCWNDVESRVSGLLWDEDAETVSDFLESVANTIVTVSRPGRDDYTGKVEGVEYLEAPPSRTANGREGVYKVNIRQVAS